MHARPIIPPDGAGQFIRVVCQNTLTMALDWGPTVRVAHTPALRRRLNAAVPTLGIYLEGFEQMEQTFRAMAGIRSTACGSPPTCGASSPIRG